MIADDQEPEAEAAPPASSVIPWDEGEVAPPLGPGWGRGPDQVRAPQPPERAAGGTEASPKAVPPAVSRGLDPSDPWADFIPLGADPAEPRPAMAAAIFRGFGERPQRPSAIDSGAPDRNLPPATLPAVGEASPAPSDAPPGTRDDTLLRAFDHHALGAESPIPVSPSLDALLGRQGAELVDEVSAAPLGRQLFVRPSISPVPDAGVDVGPRNAFQFEGAPGLPPGWAFADDEPSSAVLLSSEAAGVATLNLPRARGNARVKTVIRELVETGLLAILVFLAVRASFQNFKVDGTSMLPNLQNGEFLIVNKLVYSEVDVDKLSRFLPFLSPGNDPKRNLFHGPQRGEIVVLEDPRKPDTDLIKRVIGLPGDTIEIIDGKVYINDYYLEEPYIKKVWHYTGPKTVIPPGNYFVMGDNRDNSLDSRSPLVGLVAEDLIIGKAFVSYWPSASIGFAPNGSPKITEIKSPSFAQAK